MTCMMCVDYDEDRQDCFPLENVRSIEELRLIYIGYLLKILKDLEWCYQVKTTKKKK